MLESDLISKLNTRVSERYGKEIQYSIFSRDKANKGKGKTAMLILEVVYDNRLFKSVVLENNTYKNMTEKIRLVKEVYISIQKYESNPIAYNRLLLLDKSYNTLRHGILPDGVKLLSGSELLM
ncbi:hypothetical protein [Clostridium tertium]|uniref:hypothetical protein n=1 Tax=Clostridium tertium TaxID=1559 RepID=UPI0023B2EE60|nr:hypothetical protein [Clostridium tertium]